MTQSRFTISIKQRWVVILGLLLTFYCVVQIVRAQEITTPAEPTMIPAEMTAMFLASTDEATLENGNADLLATLAPTESIMLLTDEATIVPTAETTTAVTDSASTEAPDAPTLAPIAANINIVPGLTRLSQNDVLTLTISAEGLSDVYNVGVACQVDPSVLLGMQATNGDMLTDLSTVTDSGYQADGLWILLSKQLDDAPALTASGTLWTFSYRVIGTGVTQVNCQTQIGDRNNQPLSLVNANPVLTVESYEDAAVDVSPTLSPTASPVETEIPVNVEATEVLTEIPIVDVAVSTPDTQYHISGHIEATLPLRRPAITIREATLNQSIEVQSNGTFSADLSAGDYQFIFTAPYCLPQIISVTITDKPQRLPAIILIGGDVDQNGVIDIQDATFITQNFGLAASSAASSADLNEDGTVDIYDLALVSANIHPNQ